MDKIQIKKILRKIYNLDFTKITLRNNDEFILQNNGVSEFTQFFKKTDLDNGVIVTPTAYRSGLFFSADNTGALYSSSKLLPDMVTFGLNILGVKKNYFYRITILAKDTDTYDIITKDRSITVIDDSRQAILTGNAKGFDKYQEYTGYFRAMSNEANLYFTMGKIFIKDIIIDEVVLMEEENLNSNEKEDSDEEIPENKETLVGYGTFSLRPAFEEFSKAANCELMKYFGKGIQLFYNRLSKVYIIERSNTDNVLTEPFTNANYKIELNFNKVKNDVVFDNYKIVNISTDISANTLKQGSVSFALVKNSVNVEYPYGDENKLLIEIYKIQ